MYQLREFTFTWTQQHRDTIKAHTVEEARDSLELKLMVSQGIDPTFKNMGEIEEVQP